MDSNIIEIEPQQKAVAIAITGGQVGYSDMLRYALDSGADLDDAGFGKFYVYLHSRPCGSVFYVGKGSRGRSHEFSNSRNPHHVRTTAKIGVANVGISIFPCESEAAAFEAEIMFIDILKKSGHKLANMTDGGDGVRGHKFTAESLKKMSDAQRGKVLTPEHRAKMSASRMGREHSQETRDKISVAHIGRKKAPFTDAAKKHMSEALTGRPVSDLTRAKIAASNTGKKASIADREKMSKSHIGKPWSEARRNAFEGKTNVA